MIPSQVSLISFQYLMVVACCGRLESATSQGGVVGLKSSKHFNAWQIKKRFLLIIIHDLNFIKIYCR